MIHCSTTIALWTKYASTKLISNQHFTFTPVFLNSSMITLSCLHLIEVQKSNDLSTKTMQLKQTFKSIGDFSPNTNKNAQFKIISNYSIKATSPNKDEILIGLVNHSYLMWFDHLICLFSSCSTHSKIVF